MPRKESGMMLPDGVDINNLPDMKTLRKMLKEQRKQRSGANKDHIFRRIIGYVFRYHRVKLIIVLACLLVSSVATSSTSIIVTNLINSIIQPRRLDLLPGFIAIAAAVFVSGTAASAVQSVLMSYVVQGTLNTIRKEMFAKMQKLPVSYFDSHQHGDIMSCYTNDVDTLRQFISQTLTNLISSVVTLLTLVAIMLYYSLYLSLVVAVGVLAMFFVTKYVGGSSSRYFMLQQHEMGKLNGFIEERMHGQKVVQVFCREEESKKSFDELNERLCKTATEGKDVR